MSYFQRMFIASFKNVTYHGHNILDAWMPRCLVLAIKAKIYFGSNFTSFNFLEHRPHGLVQGIPSLPRNESTSEFMPVGDKEVEYFFASDASAVIEHTNRVIYLEVSYLSQNNFYNNVAIIDYIFS